ncbi:MAG: hypothetical protein Udaeo2_02480 [Candidatus Udaeobacter sp.]|nr:MAG: hypothetical protein Udaeo2_02480 [Candidatus Udaeobacter sp.]
MKAKLPVRIESHPFSTGDLIGGDAALDFINTVTGRDQSPRDWLDSYTRLLEWAALVHLCRKNSARAGKKGAERLQRLRRRWRAQRSCAKRCLHWSLGSFPGMRRRKPRSPCCASIGSQASMRTSCASTMGTWSLSCAVMQPISTLS